MNTKTRVSTLEARMAQINGDSLPLLLPLLEGENISEAIKRNGVSENTKRPIVFLSNDDINL